jgi:hypothetical protein
MPLTERGVRLWIRSGLSIDVYGIGGTGIIALLITHDAWRRARLEQYRRRANVANAGEIYASLIAC